MARENDIMRSIHKLLPALALLAAATAAHASEDEQLWTTASATVKLSDRWRFSQEVVARFSDDRDGLYEVEMNSLIGYRIGGKVRSEEHTSALPSLMRIQ